MRVLSFIPAFLLAAASFVAAAPAPVSTDTSCVPMGGSGNDGSIQSVIDIISEATTTIGSLNDKLTVLKGNAGSCTSDAFSEVVVEIDAAVKTCIGKLQATAHVSLDGVFLGNICVAIYALLELLICVVTNLVACILIIGVSAIATIQAAVCALLNDIIALVGCLKVYAVGSIYDTLTPVIAVVCVSVDLCLALFIKV